MSSANMYQKQLVSMRGGLDYSSGILEAPAGALSECLNFETTDYTGYRRIDGFERFDGLSSPSSVFGSSLVTASESLFDAVEAAKVESGNFVYNESNVLVGVVAFVTVTTILANTTIRAHISEVYSGAVDSATSLAFATTLGSVVMSSPQVSVSTIYLDTTGVFPPSNVANLRTSYTTIRDYKRKFSQGRIAHALHSFKRRAYAVVDFESVLVRQVPDTTTGQEQAGVIVPGDYLDYGLLGYRVQVLDVRIVSGAWGGGDQGTDVTLEAKILYRRVVGAEGLDPMFESGTVLDVIRNGTTYSDVVEVQSTLSAAADDTWAAGLYYTQLQGEQDPSDLELYGYWTPVVHPWEFEYKDGRVTSGLPPTELVRKYREPAFNAEDASADTGFVPGGSVAEGGVAGSGFFLTGGPADLETVDAAYGEVIADAVGAIRISSNAAVTDFDMSTIPDDARITGYEVKVVARWNPTTAAIVEGGGTIGTEILAVNKPYIGGVQILGANVVGENKGSTSVTIDGDTDQTFTFGGAFDKWGIDDLGTAVVKSPEFGVKVSFGKASTNSPLIGLTVLDINQIVIKVYYTKASTTYYFWNGTDDVKADVVKVHTAKGDWNDDGDRPEGTMIVTNVTPVGSAARNNIGINDEMRTVAGGASGDLICIVSSNMSVCGLASLSQIIAAKSRYQIITANYYGDEDWRAMYGANGAGRAFSYDGTYFQKIFTGSPIEKDKPRHIRSYKSLAGTNGSLALGFPSGSVQCSVAGEPENFSGQSGAIEVSAASPVVGLATMQGTTLGIFTLDGIYGIKGLSTASELFSIRPKTGVLEYTVQEVGSDVYYCDVYGIRSINQTDAYGDFTGSPMSSAVSSWLQPRLRKTTDETQAAVPGIVRASMIVRSKNQYRLFFRDGWVLTMTIKSTGPEFTTQRYAFTSSSVEYVYTPIALCSEVDDNGKELLLFSHYADYAAATDTINSQDRKRYVLALDRGWSFDGEVIQCYITPYYNFFDQQFFDFKQVNKVRAFGLSRGVGTLNVYAGKEFEDVSSSNAQDISLTFGTSLSVDAEQATALANIAKRGTSIRLKFEGSTTITEPSYVIQSLLLQYLTSKGDI